jgi:hypothetical protein
MSHADLSEELFADVPSTMKLKTSADLKDVTGLSEDSWTVSSTISAAAATMGLLVRTGSLRAVAQTIRERRRRAFARATPSLANHVDSASW